MDWPLVLAGIVLAGAALYHMSYVIGKEKQITELVQRQKYIEQQNMELKKQNDWLLSEFATKTGIKPLPGRGEAPKG